MDTLNMVANSSELQQIAVIVQGLFLAVGALITLFQKRR